MYNNEHEKHFINYEELVNEIKTFSISNVIGRYVKLKRSGAGKWLCLCPFHHEKTPSFNIDDREGFFKCFGCGEGGDVIKFIEKIKGCDFKQAIDYLCDILVIDKEKYTVKTTSKQQNASFSTLEEPKCDIKKNDAHRRHRLSENLICSSKICWNIVSAYIVLTYHLLGYVAFSNNPKSYFLMLLKA